MDMPVLTVVETLTPTGRGTWRREWHLLTGAGEIAGWFRSLDAALRFARDWLAWWT